MSYLEPMFSIFMVSIILALVLDFPVQFLQRRGLSRNYSLFFVLAFGLAIIILLAILLIPALLGQILQLIELIPTWVDTLGDKIATLDRLSIAGNIDINWVDLGAKITNQLSIFVQAFTKGLFNLLVSGFSGGLTLFFVIILTIFLLISGQAAWEGILEFLPLFWQEHLREEVPLKLRKFLGGQFLIATGFSFVLALIFTIIEVPLGLLFGFTIGMASLLPFMGAISQISVSLFLMLNDLSTGIIVFIIALVLGQIVDNIVVPKVMGKLVGVNPIWLLIAVFIGGKLKGIVGILLAVPIASIIKNIAEDLKTTPQVSLNPSVVSSVAELTSEKNN